MQLMGIVDEHSPSEFDMSDWNCPLTTSDAELLAIASWHVFMEGAYDEEMSDGYVLLENINSAVSKIVKNERYTCMCNCVKDERYV